MHRLKEIYQKRTIPQMKQGFGFKNDFQVPRIKKIVVNVGINSQLNPKLIEQIEENIQAITGQKPVKTKAKKSIAGFKIKEGQVVGLKATLRNEKMYDFLEKLIHIVSPRMKDFKGLSCRFDHTGNLTIGFENQLPFPEIDTATELLYGLEVTIITTAKKDEEAKALLQSLGFLFKES